jgi:TolB-like protein
MLIGIGLGAAAVYTLLRPSPENELSDVSAETLPTIAVLPFRNMSPDPDNAFFTQGVHEEILTALSRFDGMKVISRTSVMRFTETDLGLPEIASMLGATHILEGSVRRVDNTVRVTAQLIDASEDQHLWAENYDREVQDVLAIQSQIATNIAGTLGAELSSEQMNRVAPAQSRNPDAYDLYLKARSRLGRMGDLDGLREALELLDKAVAIEPDFAEAWQLRVRMESWFVYAGNDGDNAHLAAAQAALDNAQRLAPDSADTKLARTWFLYHGRSEYSEALEEIRRAQQLEPRRAEFVEVEAYVLRALGDFEQATERLETALELDPLNANAQRQLASEYRWLERYERSYEILRSVLENQRAPNRILEYEVKRARVYANPSYSDLLEIMESEVDWLLEFDDEVRTSDYSMQERSTLVPNAYFYLKSLGRADEAERVLNLMPQESLCLECMAYHETRRLEFRGEHEEALEAARRAIESGNTLDPAFFDRPNGGLGFKAWLAAYTGDHETAEASVARLREAYANHQHAMRRYRGGLYLLMEAQTVVAQHKADALFLDNDAAIPPIHDLATRLHLWYRLLDNPEIRDRFDGHPEWVQFMRDCWPESRPFPFDQDET